MLLTVIQARMGSTRLPGKVLRDLGARPVLQWVIDAARTSRATDGIVVATSTDPSDDAVADHALAAGVDVVRGSEDDVLSRFVAVLDRHDPTAVVRLTADCPLLDPAIIRMTAAAFSAGDVDYVSTVVQRTLPRGLDVEVVSAAALRLASAEASGADRAHVTSYVWRRPEQFRVAGLTFTPGAKDLRLTLDTVEDAAVLDAVVAELGDRSSSWRLVVDLLRRRPDIATLNADVAQKPIEEG